MSVPFQCPACLKQLIYESGSSTFLVCRHCKSRIIIPSTVIHQQEALEVKPTKYTLEEKRGIKLAEVQREIQAGRKVSAINVFSQAFDTDLATAKAAVELLEQGKQLPAQAITTVAPERPVEQRIYTNQIERPRGSARSAPIIFWLIVSIGIAIAAIFLRDN